jgi:hypothetical protein
VARMPPVDSTTGLVCFLRSFSAPEDQRAEILPVQRPPALADGGRYFARTLVIAFQAGNVVPRHFGTLALRKSFNANDLIFQTVEDGFKSWICLGSVSTI